MTSVVEFARPRLRSDLVRGRVERGPERWPSPPAVVGGVAGAADLAGVARTWRCAREDDQAELPLAFRPQMATSPSRGSQREELVGIVGWPQITNECLAEAWQALGIQAGMLSPDEARSFLRSHDVALGRFDVLETLDGVQPGLHVLTELERRGVRVVNGVDALINAHDKLRSARLLARAGLPHPRTSHLIHAEQAIEIAPPVVVKPRFGSWGRDVFRCETTDDLRRTLDLVSARPWFVRHGALVQELVPPTGYDLRLVVAAGRVVGATERVACPGEWRTNVSLGGTRRRARPSSEAYALAIRAADVIGAGLVGIDLLPTGDGYVVLELNGAVEFDRAYDLEGSNVYAATAAALGLPSFARKCTRKVTQGTASARSRPRR
jgi:RimK family alpha-L-glutamate ligase